MTYIPLEQYPKAWIFRHRDMPVSDEDMLEIKPLTEARAEQIWAQHISRQGTHPDHFAKGDWAADESNWFAIELWQSAWDSDNENLPEVLADHLKDWDDAITIFFCYESDHIIETKWGVFRRNWKNFLFFDSGPILIGRKKKQVAQFFENGQFRIGVRS